VTSNFFYVLGAGRDPASVAADVRRAVAAIDPKLPIYDVRPLGEYVANAVAMRRFTMQLAAAFALVALTLACIGVYGVMAYAVTRRRQEFGIRLALGAEPRRVLGVVMAEGLRLTLAGIALGVGGALATSHFLEAQLYGVRARDPFSYAATIILLVAAAAIACFVPARRATAVTPMETLRAE
jgi:ABC-type antimicrobial peptide transport system permease subunit